MEGKQETFVGSFSFVSGVIEDQDVIVSFVFTGDIVLH